MTVQIGLPKKAFYVRKRWDGDGVYLIHLTDIVRVDSFSEMVWDCLDGKTDLEQIATIIAGAFPEIDPLVNEALIAQNIMLFAEHNFVHVG